MLKITGGERVGNNLFHSFEEFSISEGTEAIFENAPDIANIFIQITGDNISFLDGILQATGKANVFLINPKGIVFGEKARLDIGGSFVATAGDRFDLTATLPKKINFHGDNGSITEYRNINLEQKSLIKSISKEIESISLRGKNIKITNGSFILAQSQDNLPSSAINIKASETLTLSGCPKSPKLPSAIRSEALNTGKGATIYIWAKELVVRDSGRIRTYSFSDGFGGDINVTISGSSQFSKGSIIATTYGKGNAGNIQVSTSQLELNLAGITSSTFGEGNGGIVDVNARLIDIAGKDSGDRGSIAATSWGSGNGGKVKINTSQLRVREGASLSSSSFSFGNAGDLTINATESVEVIGVGSSQKSQGGNNPQSTIRCAVQTVSPGARKAFKLPEVPTGNSGNLIINTPVLKITQAGVITVENQGTGRAGKVEIITESLTLDEAGSITAAAESKEGGEIFVSTQNLQIGNNSKITAAGNENSGNITIQANHINVTW